MEAVYRCSAMPCVLELGGKLTTITCRQIRLAHSSVWQALIRYESYLGTSDQTSLFSQTAGHLRAQVSQRCDNSTPWLPKCQLHHCHAACFESVLLRTVGIRLLKFLFPHGFCAYVVLQRCSGLIYRALVMSTQLGPASMDGSHDEFFDLEEVEAMAKQKLKKPVSIADGMKLDRVLRSTL